jgi:hypothetical protein
MAVFGVLNGYVT